MSTIENTHPDAPDRTTPERARETRRVLVSSYLGSAVEFYDFLLYGTAAALVFPTVFFAGLDPAAAVVLSLGTFAAGYIARPFGGLIFGHFGDRLGRKKILIVTLVLMGVASTLIGLVPGSAAIGSWGAVILVLLRVVQGIAVGGEWGGAALMAMEHSTSGKRGFSASLVAAGAPSGALLGTALMGVFALLPEEQFFAWGWRVPFLLSAVLLVIGLWVRARVSESPVFLEALARAAETKAAKQPLPVWSVLRRPKVLILVTLAAAAPFAFQTSMATFAQTYATEVGGSPRSVVLFAYSVASFVSIFTVIFAGRLSDRWGRRPVIIAGLVLFAVTGAGLFAMWGSGNGWLVAVGFTAGLFFQTLAFGPLGAFIGEQFATGARYTGASLGYQLGTLLGGGFTPAILATLYAQNTATLPVVLFLGGVAVVSLVAVLLTREGRRNDLATVQH
ncbi:MAG TPA: MFS transporter [Microbacterium sp.]|nr:MFS transporter [Microbacterium sp.]